MNHVDGAETIARRQDAVESCRRTSALDVPQHQRSRFEARAFLDLIGHGHPNSAEPQMAKFVALFASGRLRAASKSSALGGDDDAEISPTSVPLLNQFRHLVDIERNL